MQNYKRIIYWPLTKFSQNETKHSLLLVNGHIKQFIYKQLSRPRDYGNSCSENPARFASEILLILWIFPHTLRTTKKRAAALSFCGVDGTRTHYLLIANQMLYQMSYYPGLKKATERVSVALVEYIGIRPADLTYFVSDF